MAKKIINIRTVIILLLLLILGFVGQFLSNRYIRAAEEQIANNNYEKAFINYEKAEILNPFNALINIKKAEIYEKIGNDKKAIVEYQKALSKKSDSKTKSRLIELLIKNEDANKSLKYILTPTDNYNSKDYTLSVSKALFILGDKDDSYKILGKIDDKDLLIQKSIYYFVEKKYESAKDTLKEIEEEKDNKYLTAVLANTNNLDFYRISVAESLNETNQPYFGKIILEDMLGEKKDYRDIYLYLANSYMMQNNLDKAKQNAEKAIEKDPIYGLSYYLLSQINLKQGDSENSQKNNEKARSYGYTPAIP